MATGDETDMRAVARFTVSREPDPLPGVLRSAVAAIGNFDGVHRGHRALIDTARALADASAPPRPAIALLFDPHPRDFFAPHSGLFRLTGLPEKELIFGRLGLDGMVVRRFDAAFAATSARDFVEGVLVVELGLSAVVVGHDFRFGRGREGSPETLAALCESAGLACRIVPAVPSAVDAAPVSSTAIRDALARGDVAIANAMLDHRWFVMGEVLHGEKRGRELGFPTANLTLAGPGLAYGIYGVRARLPDGSLREGVASYGSRPTFDDGAPLLEVHLFDYSGDLYGQTLAVEFLGFIRPEWRFDSVEALVERMHRDADEARTLAATDTVPSMLT